MSTPAEHDETHGRGPKDEHVDALDSAEGHTYFVAEWDPQGRRVFIEDLRGHDAYLRATWHPDTRVVVISHWQGNVCAASTPIVIGDASQLIGLLVAALEEAATDPSSASAEPPGFTGRNPGGREPSGGAASPCPP